MDPTTELTTTPNPIHNKSVDAYRDALAWDRVILRNDLRLYIREAWHVIEPSTVYLNNWHIDLIAEHLEAVTLGQIKRLLINMHLRLYIREAWHVVEPSTIYLENWHIDLIAEYLEAVTLGQIKRLLINLPPRQSKSTCVSIMWPTWVWTREAFPGKPHNSVLEGPGTRWIFASYADELRTKHSLDRRKLLQSEWYRTRWPKPAELTSDQNVKTLFSNSSSGVMLATTMSGAAIGTGGSYVILDDPHKTKEESISAEIQSQVRAYSDTFATRHDDKKQGVTVIVMQRINDNDLSAHVLATKEEDYVHLKIEAEAPERKVIVYPRSGKILVREAGQLMWPRREGPREIARMKAVMGKWIYSAQYQQDQGASRISSTRPRMVAASAIAPRSSRSACSSSADAPAPMQAAGWTSRWISDPSDGAAAPMDDEDIPF